MGKCAYRMFGPGTDSVLVTDLRSRTVDFQGPDNAPGAVLASRFDDVLARLAPADPVARALAELLLADRLCPSVNPPCVRVAGTLRAETTANPVSAAQFPEPPLPTQFSRCPYLKLAISTTGSTIDRVIIDADSAIGIPAEHVCVELLGPEDWIDPTVVPDHPVEGEPANAWNVQGAVRICRTCDAVEVFGRLTEFQVAGAGATITKVIPRGTRRAWFFPLTVLQTWTVFAGDPAAGGIAIGVIFIPANNVEPVWVPDGSHIQAVFQAQQSIGWVWEIQPL